MSRTRAALAALLVIPALLLAGCSDDDPEPKFAPSSPPPTSATPSATPSSTMSVEHQDQSTLIEQFVAAVSDSLATGNPAGFLKLTSQSCQNCRVLADNLSRGYANGGRIEGGEWSIISLKFRGEEPLGSIWNVDIRSARERWMDGDDQLVKIVRAGTQHFGFALEETGDGWRVRELRLRA